MVNLPVMELETFDQRHHAVVTIALAVYIEYMRDEAGKALAAYEAIKDDPEKRAAQDKTFMTTRGLHQSGVLFDQSADSAQRALNDYETLTGDIESF